MEQNIGKKSKNLFLGGGVGLINSLFGGGGGMLAVPMLRATGLDEKSAHATAILLILPVSLLSFLFYAWKGLYDISVLLPTAIGVSLGGGLGAKLLERLPTKAVGVTFAFLQLVAGVFLFFGGK